MFNACILTGSGRQQYFIFQRSNHHQLKFKQSHQFNQYLPSLNKFSLERNFYD